MSVVIKVEWLGGHERTPTDVENDYVKSFDPDVNEGGGELVTTVDKTQALQFPNPGEALRYYRQASKVCPLRPDGLPNRPLTAFTVTIENY
jgi:hypothetical protein